MSEFSSFCKFEKVDSDLGIAFGFAIVCTKNGEPYVDVQGDWIPDESMLKASSDFMLTDRAGKEMHSGPKVGQVVFAFPLTKAIGDSLGILSDRTGLLIGWKPSDPAVLAKIKDGTYKGFSIGGKRIKEHATSATIAIGDKS